MSLANWIEKYYPWPLQDPNITPSEAIQRCLSKWEGLAHLKEFNLRANSHYIHENTGWGDPFPLGPDSCGLCQLYYKGPHEQNSCDDCLFTRLLGHPCDEPYGDGTRSEWWYWANQQNPYFMVDALLRIYDLYNAEDE